MPWCKALDRSTTTASKIGYFFKIFVGSGNYPTRNITSTVCSVYFLEFLINPINQISRSGGKAELANASVVHPRDPGYNLDVDIGIGIDKIFSDSDCISF